MTYVNSMHNATQAGFCGANMAIKMQDNIYEALDNLAMAATEEKDVLSQLTSNIKYLSGTNKILTDQVKTLTETNVRLMSNGVQHQQHSGKATTGNIMKPILNQQDIVGPMDSKL